MKKKYVFIFLALGVLFNLLYFVGALEPFKKIVPLSVKNFVKNTILYIPAQYKKKESKLFIYEKLANQTISLQSRVNELESLKDAINTQVFPKTEFVELEYVSHDIHSIKKKEVLPTGEITSPFYLELFDNNLIISSRIGKFFYLPINSYLDKKTKQVAIKHNLKKNIEITDLLVHDDKLFVAYYDRDVECGNFSISLSTPVPSGIAAVAATIRSSWLMSSIIPSAKAVVKLRPLDRTLIVFSMTWNGLGE